MQNIIILVIQGNDGVVVIGVVSSGHMSLQGGVAGDHAGVDMIRHINTPEAFRAHILLQAVIHTEAALQHLPVFLKAGFAGDPERRDG